MPVARIAAVCASVSGEDGPPALLVDGAQGAGASETDVVALGADFYLFSGHKWCCGPSGLAALYVRPQRLMELSSPLCDSGGDFRGTSARRMEVATFAYPLCSGLNQALKLHEAAGGCAERNLLARQSAATLRAGLRSFGPTLRLLPSAAFEGATGIVSFSIEGVDSQELVRYLESRQILLSALHRPDCVRACVHYLTSEEEIRRLIEEIHRFRRRAFH